MALPKILLINDSIDIYNPELGLANMIPNLLEKKTFARDKLYTNEIVIQVKDFKNFFSLDNPSSTFFNTRWRYTQCKIIDEDGILIWDGVIQDIKVDHERSIAFVISRNRLVKYFNRLIEYESSGWETPATAFKNIADSIGFENYDVQSVGDSENFYIENGCFIRCFIFKEDDTTFQQITDKLAMIGVADAYSHNNNIYFKVFKPFIGGTVIDINDENLRSFPVVESLESELTNDFEIDYFESGGVPAVDGEDDDAVGKISRQENYNGIRDVAAIDGSEGNQIEIKDETAALFIGRNYIKRSHFDLFTNPRPVKSIIFDISRKYRSVINTTTFLRLTFSREKWTNKLFEVFQTDVSADKNNIKVLAVEREET